MSVAVPPTCLSLSLSLALAGTFAAFTVQAQPGAAAASISGTVRSARARPVVNSVVYVEAAPGTFAPPAKPVVIDQKDQQFKPFVTPVLVGTTVTFQNSDATDHNVFTPDGEKYDLGVWSKGGARSYTFKRAGVYTQLCKLHPSMIAYVIVLQNPFHAVVDAKGAYRIGGLPPGRYTVKTWNERKPAAPQTVEVAAGQTATLDLELGK